MGMGYSANLEIVINESEIKKLNIGSFNTFLSTLNKVGVTLDQFAQAEELLDELSEIVGDIPQQDEEELLTIYSQFKKDFASKTGINIDLRYHNRLDDGDRYDEVDGAFFALEYSDVYKMSPEAKELAKTAHFDFASFVSFG